MPLIMINVFGRIGGGWQWGDFCNGYCEDSVALGDAGSDATLGQARPVDNVRLIR